MAIRISNLSVLFSANTGRFKKNVRGAMKPLQKMKKTAAGLTGSFVKLAGGVFALGGAFKALRGTVGLVMRSIQESMEFERIEVGLAALVKDAARAKVLFKDLQKFALSTTFVFKDTLAASRTMIAFGEDVENVIPTLAVLGNIAAAVNMPLQELAFIFEQSRVEGKLLQRDMRQFATRGIPIADAIAKRLGIVKAQIGDLTKSGSIGFNVLAQSFKDMATAGGPFVGMMGAIAQTVSGRFERLKDQVQLLLKTIGDEIVAAFSLDVVLDRAFKKLQEFREKGKGAMREIAEWFRDRMIVAVKVADLFFRGLLAFAGTLLGVFAEIASGIERIANRLEKKGLFERAIMRMRNHAALLHTAFFSPGGVIAGAGAQSKSASAGMRDFAKSLIEASVAMPDLGKELKALFADSLPSAEELTKRLQALADTMKTEFDPFRLDRKNMEAFFDTMQKKIDKLEDKSFGEKFAEQFPKNLLISRLPAIKKSLADVFDRTRLSELWEEAQRLGPTRGDALHFSAKWRRGIARGYEDTPRGQWVAANLKAAEEAVKKAFTPSEQQKNLFDGFVSDLKQSAELIKIEFDRMMTAASVKKKFKELSQKFLGLDTGPQTGLLVSSRQFGPAVGTSPSTVLGELEKQTTLMKNEEAFRRRVERTLDALSADGVRVKEF